MCQYTHRGMFNIVTDVNTHGKLLTNFRMISMHWCLITVGDSDGIMNGKRYFKCERPQALFVEANRVALTVTVKVTIC